MNFATACFKIGFYEDIDYGYFLFKLPNSSDRMIERNL